MERTKVVRGLRITWTVFWGIVCLLLVVLWVSSYWWLVDTTKFTGNVDPQKGVVSYTIASYRGEAYIDLETTTPWSNWLRSTSLHTIHEFSWHGFLWQYNVATVTFGMPHWFPAMVSGLLAAVPWIRWQFRLRTLLIATTLIAAVLGIVVYVSR